MGVNIYLFVNLVSCISVFAKKKKPVFRNTVLRGEKRPIFHRAQCLLLPPFIWSIRPSGGLGVGLLEEAAGEAEAAREEAFFDRRRVRAGLLVLLPQGEEVRVKAKRDRKMKAKRLKMLMVMKVTAKLKTKNTIMMATTTAAIHQNLMSLAIMTSHRGIQRAAGHNQAPIM